MNCEKLCFHASLMRFNLNFVWNNITPARLLKFSKNMRRFTTLYSTVINRSRFRTRKKLSPQPFYWDDRRSRVDRVRNGIGSGHCCAKRVEEWILPRMDFGWDYAVLLSILFDVEFIEPPTWTAFPFVVISGRVNRDINDVNSKIIFILTNYPKTLLSNVFLFFLRYNRHSLNLKSTLIKI